MNEIEFSDEDRKGYIGARSFAREIGKEILSNIKVGMTEKEIEEVVSGIFKKKV